MLPIGVLCIWPIVSVRMWLETQIKQRRVWLFVVCQHLRPIPCKNTHLSGRGWRMRNGLTFLCGGPVEPFTKKRVREGGRALVVSPLLVTSLGRRLNVTSAEWQNCGRRLGVVGPALWYLLCLMGRSRVCGGVPGMRMQCGDQSPQPSRAEL